MKEIEIVKYKIPDTEEEPIEVYQQTNIGFAFLSSPKDGSRQCHRFILCRDFLVDVINTMVSHRDTNVYFFSYKEGTNPPADLKRTRILVKAPLRSNEKAFEKKMQCSLNMIKYYEDMAEWQNSQLFRVTDCKDTWLFLGPSDWMSCSFLLSMYTFLIRLGDKNIPFKSGDDLTETYRSFVKKHTVKDHVAASDNDIMYLMESFDKLHLIIKHRHELFSDKIQNNYSKNYRLADIHDFGGISYLSRFQSYDRKINDKFKGIYKNDSNKTTQW